MSSPAALFVPMDLNGMDQNGIDDISFEPPVPLNSYTEGVYGDPQVSPRVGDQYQVEIPVLISESEYSSYTTDPLEDENKGGPRDFVMGLPISIIWVNQEVKPIRDGKFKFLCDLKHASKRSRPYEHNVESSDAGSRIAIMETDELEEKTDEINGFLVPGSYGDYWSDIEKASFLLGLYIFRKNFVQVKKFVETKMMGEILLLYHTKFYQTAEYRRWSVCRKGKTRNCALGQRLFSGLRQHELLSRLFRGISEELQSALLQVSKIFSDGKILLEEYIFSLKNMVGISNLVNAVGIGGKKDLTVGAIESSKANQTILIQPEMPFGKACSSLSTNEIVKFLTGDYRLSKARSADLFWEAVWPILVNKGWDSTESSSYNYAVSSKQSHVFFAPGVPKLPSRKGLVKGEEYFDSIADVLNLIASDPGILDLGKEKDGGKGKTIVEDGNDDLTAESRRHCSLQPTRSRRTDVIAFTVVDTSLDTGKTYDLRNLRDLPVEDTPDDAPYLSTDDSDCAYTMAVEEDNENVTKLTRVRSENGTFVKRKDLEAETSLNHGIGSKNVNAGNDHIAPDGKRRRRLTACSNEGSSQGVVNWTRPSSDMAEMSENVRASSIENFEERAQDNEPNERPLFDLNLPAEPLDLDCNDFAPEVAEPQPQDAPDELGEPQPQDGPDEPMAGAEEEQVNLNSRRQSSRNRPPTARALEAIAHGFLSVSSRRVRGESSRSRSRSSQEEGRGSGVGTSDVANGTNSNISENGEI